MEGKAIDTLALNLKVPWPLHLPCSQIADGLKEVALGVPNTYEASGQWGPMLDSMLRKKNEKEHERLKKFLWRKLKTRKK